MIVVGAAFTILGVLLLIVSAVVTFAVSTGASGCVANACDVQDPGPWFGGAGLLVLLFGAGLLALGVWRGMRR
jgi:hypothetical protein